MDSRLALGIGSVAVVIVSAVVASRFNSKLKHLHKLGYLGIFLGCLVGSVGNPVAPVVTVISGRYYPAWLVGFVGALGAVLGEILSYNIGGLGQLVIKDQSWFETLHQTVDKNGFWAILLITAIPNPVFNIGAGVSGALHYPMWKFLIASFGGNWLQYTLFAAFGSATKRIV